MEKKDFEEHTRYAVTMRDENGKLRPANLYIYRLHDGFMIARLTGREGYLEKVPYEDIVKIVRKEAVEKGVQFRIPEALLKAETWKDRTRMNVYASAPSLGK